MWPSHFVIKIPDAIASEDAAPMLCGGIMYAILAAEEEWGRAGDEGGYCGDRGDISGYCTLK